MRKTLVAQIDLSFIVRDRFHIEILGKILVFPAYVSTPNLTSLKIVMNALPKPFCRTRREG